jgi:hypothetical protein
MYDVGLDSNEDRKLGGKSGNDIGTSSRRFCSSGFPRKGYLVSAHTVIGEVCVIGKLLHPS